MQSGTHKGVQHAGEFFLVLRGQWLREPCQISESIYYRGEDCLYVNLFIPSELAWKEKRVESASRDPFPGRRNHSLDLGIGDFRRLAVKLRYPSWSGRPTVRVNGKSVRVKQHPGSYITLDRRWEDGDRIEVTYPMRLAMERMPDNPRKGALLYGPVVLAGVLGTEGMQPPAPYSNPFRYNDYYTYDYHIPQGLPCSLPWDDRHPERVLKRTGKRVGFRHGKWGAGASAV